MGINNKKLVLAIVGMLLLPIAGCGNDQAGGNGSEAKPVAKMEVPARAEVATAPTEVFKFGDHEGKVYELTGVDLQKLIRTGKIVTLGQEIFFHTDSAGEADKHQHMRKVTMKGETITDLTDLGQSGDIASLATNGKVVVWPSADSKLAIYDGTDVKIGDKWRGLMAGDAESGEFYRMRGGTFELVKLENGEQKETRTVVEDMRKQPGFEKAGLSPICVDNGEWYLRYVIRENDKDQHYLLALDKDGKELRRYEGLTELPRGWAVTANYVIHACSKGELRIFDKATGQIIADTKINLRPFALWTITGNDVILYDDRADKLYRIDF
ncbi:MAG: hypothetical protein IJ849_10580 [Selenomonadaceae bacterium]|nr:hypothetical protein [Selenomonadaceae bacterium]